MATAFWIELRGLARSVRNLKGAASRAKPIQVRAVERATLLVERDLKTNGMSGKAGYNQFWGKTGSDPSTGEIAVRSGSTRRSVVRDVLEVRGLVIGVVGTPLHYMKILEEGGQIAGKPLLRIPTAAMKTGAGVDRLAGQSARVLQRTWIGKSRKGNLFIFAAGRRGEAVALYMLVTKVNIRARHVFRNSLRRTRTQVVGQVAQAAVNISQIANGG